MRTIKKFLNNSFISEQERGILSLWTSFLSPRRIPLKVTLLVTVDLPGEFFVSFFLILLGTQNGKHVNYLKTIRDILNNLLCVICDHDSQNHVLYHLPYNVYAYVRGLDCCGNFKATYNVYLL